MDLKNDQLSPDIEEQSVRAFIDYAPGCAPDEWDEELSRVQRDFCGESSREPRENFRPELFLDAMDLLVCWTKEANLDAAESMSPEFRAAIRHDPFFPSSVRWRTVVRAYELFLMVLSHQYLVRRVLAVVLAACFKIAAGAQTPACTVVTTEKMCWFLMNFHDKVRSFTKVFRAGEEHVQCFADFDPAKRPVTPSELQCCESAIRIAFSSARNPADTPVFPTDIGSVFMQKHVKISADGRPVLTIQARSSQLDEKSVTPSVSAWVDRFIAFALQTSMTDEENRASLFGRFAPKLNDPPLVVLHLSTLSQIRSRAYTLRRTTAGAGFPMEDIVDSKDSKQDRMQLGGSPEPTPRASKTPPNSPLKRKAETVFDIMHSMGALFASVSPVKPSKRPRLTF